MTDNQMDLINRTKPNLCADALLRKDPMDRLMSKPLPTISVTMDERLAYIASDMGTDERLLLRVDDKELEASLLEAWDYLKDHATECTDRMRAYRHDCLGVLEDMLDTLDNAISQTYPHWKETCHANR